jgi:hypothetical protein
LATANHHLGYQFIGKFVINGQRKLRLLHKVIAHTFLENPNGYTEINHKDGNKHNCAVDNLEYCTRSENIQHGWALGLFENFRNKTSRPILQYAIDGTFIKEYESTVRASRETGISKDTIRKIAKNTTRKPRLFSWKYKDSLEMPIVS